MCTSTTTSKTELPPQTDAERQMQDWAVQMMPLFMEEAGYVKDDTAAKDYKDYPEYADIENARPQFKARGGSVGEKGLRMLDAKEQELKDRASKESGGFRKKLSPELEAIRASSGVDSPEYKAKFAEYEQAQFKTYESEEQIKSTFLEKTQKFLAGDFSITESQANVIKEHLAPQREVINQLFGSLQKLGPQEAAKQMDSFIKSAQESGMSLAAATEAAGAYMKNGGGGGSLDRALTDVIATHEQMLEMGIEDYTGEMTKKVMSQAAAIGRDPSDPAYQNEIQENISREVTRGGLQLAGMEAQGRMDIQRQGAAARLGVAEQSTAMRAQAGGGMAPQQLGAGGSAQQLMMARQQQGLSNMQAGLGAPMGMMGQFANLRMAQPTTTQTSRGSPLSMLLGLGTGIAGAYSGFSQASAMRGLGSSIKGLYEGKVKT